MESIIRRAMARKWKYAEDEKVRTTTEVKIRFKVASRLIVKSINPFTVIDLKRLLQRHGEKNVSI